jgi:hypothetical protein
MANSSSAVPSYLDSELGPFMRAAAPHAFFQRQPDPFPVASCPPPCFQQVRHLRPNDSSAPKHSDPTGVMNGAIDDVRIYNRALNAQEILQLYHLGTANIAHSNIGNANGLVGYWPFNGRQINWTTGVTNESENG